MTIEKMCNGWAKGIASGEGNGSKQWKSCNVYYSGRTIYSYGSHFPMAHIVAPNLVWLNGDRFSPSTDRHQRELRSAIARQSGVTVVIVPNSALEAANVDYRTLEPIDVHADRTEYTLHTSDVAPAGMQRNLTETVTRTDYTAPRNAEGQWPNPFPKVTREEKVTAGYGDHINAWHGDTESFPDVVGWIATESTRELVRRNPSTGEYSWHTARHWLGDSVIKSSDGRYFVSSFDHQERRPLYFLSQLPGPVDTVDEAIESLAPDSVKTARDMGRDVVRQGDMFAIPMDVTTRELRKLGATFTKRRVTIEPNRYAREQIAKREIVNELLATMPPHPTRQYWLGHVQESRDDFMLIYADYQRACDAWSNELVARCDARYPDNNVTHYNWTSARDYKPSTHHMSRNTDAEALYGTAHTASEVATLPDGRQFARGILYHDPAVIGQTRAADHRRQKLGKQWHLVARNTVPVSGTGSGRRAR